MLSAHMDEIGFMVTHIEEAGYLRLIPLGGFDPKTLTAQRVMVHGREDLLGVLGTKAVHLMSEEEKRRAPTLDDYFVDLGLSSERVRELVRPGDVVTRERAMARLGADPANMAAAIGPCIGQASYEVGADLRGAVLAHDPADARFFAPGHRAMRWQFDLPGYCAARLAVAGVGSVAVLGVDTAADAERFFSYRRQTLAGGGPIGHQISIIAL